MEGSAGIGLGELPGMPQRRQGLREPGPGDRLGPIGIRRGRLVFRNAGAGQQAHRLTEGKPVAGGATLDRVELLQGPAEALAVDLDPFAADQREAVRLGQQLLDLRRGEAFALQRHLHPEIEKRVHPELGRRLAAHRRLHRRACGAIHAPACRHAQDDPGRLEGGRVLEELQRLPRGPAQRVEDLARIDHLLQPGAAFGGALDGHQQGQQAFAIPGAGIFLQGLAQRQVLRPGLGRESRRIGREKREGCGFILPVLGEVEMHASHQVPGRMASLEEILHRELRLGALGIEGQVGGAPKIGQDRCHQILRPGHGRRGRGHPRELALLGQRRGRLLATLADIRKRAERRHITGAQLAPIGEDRGQRRADLLGTQAKEAVAGPSLERLRQAYLPPGLQRESVSR